MSLAGNIWGISGPTFVVLYLALAAASVAAALLLRRRVYAGRAHQRPRPDLADSPADVAYLNGGSRLAVLAACGALSAIHAIRSEAGWLYPEPVHLPPNLPPLAGVVHRALVASPTHQLMLRSDNGVRAELATIRQRLTRDRLLLTRRWIAVVRLAGLLPVAVGVLGGWGLAAGLSPHEFVGILMLCLIATVAVAVAYQATVRRRTRRGDIAYRAVRTGNRSLSPEMQPDLPSYGPDKAALAVGVFGAAALWTAAPALAGALRSTTLAVHPTHGVRFAAGGGSSGPHHYGGAAGGCGSAGGGCGCGGGGCGGGGCGGGGGGG